MILNWLISICRSFLVDLSGVFVVPIALLIGGLNNRLPSWAQRWDNDRDPFGDNARRPPIEAATGLKKMWLRYLWLAWRNPGNNYSYQLGFKQIAGTVYVLTGDSQVSDQGYPGRKFVTAWQDGEAVAFDFYLVYRYPFWPAKCLRIRLGWKIEDNVGRKIEDGSMAQIVCVPNPLMSFEAVTK